VLCIGALGAMLNDLGVSTDTGAALSRVHTTLYG